jgi:hypothetical protein
MSHHHHSQLYDDLKLCFLEGAAGFSFFGETAVENVGSTVNSCCTVAADDDSMVGEMDHFSSPLASQPTV